MMVLPLVILLFMQTTIKMHNLIGYEVQKKIYIYKEEKKKTQEVDIMDEV